MRETPRRRLAPRERKLAREAAPRMNEFVA
jgi:hypothetical protein